MDIPQYAYRIGMADYYVIGAYLPMLVSIGFVLEKLCGGVKDYFVGGNKIPWWLADETSRTMLHGEIQRDSAQRRKLKVIGL